MKRYSRIPGILFPEKGGYTKAQYAYYKQLKEKIAKRDDYRCVSCGKVSPFKLKWGCSKQPNYQTESPDAHCITCPFLPTLPQNELVEKAYVEGGKETIRVFWKKGCMSCPDEARTKIVSPTERDITDFCLHHLDGNPYNQSDSNVAFCCLSCNHKSENTKNGRKKDADMLFSKKKQEEDSNIVEEKTMFNNKEIEDLQKAVGTLQKADEQNKKEIATLKEKQSENENKLLEAEKRMLDAVQTMQFVIPVQPMSKGLPFKAEVPIPVRLAKPKSQPSLKAKHPLRIKERLKRKAIDNEATKMQHQNTQYRDHIDEIAINAIKQHIKAKQKKFMSINEIDEIFYPILVENDLPRTLVNCYKNWLLLDKFFKKSGRNTYEILS